MSSLINPYRQAREMMNLSQQEVADQAIISVSAVRFNEMGLYVNPLPKLTEFFGRFFDSGALVRNYFRFQKRRREENKRMWLMPPVDVRKEPLRALLEFNNLGVTRFCKLYCCQSSILHRPRRIMNSDLGKVLRDAGLTPPQIQELHDRLVEYYEYRNFGRDRSKDRNVSGAEVL